MVARIEDFPFKAGVIPTPYMPDPVLLAIVEIIRDGLVRDHHVRLHQFGTFRLQWTKPRRFKHPQTGEYMLSKPAPKITFTPAKHLKDLIEPNPKALIPLNDVSAGPASAPPAESDSEACIAKDLVNEDSPQAAVQDMMQDIIDERVSQQTENRSERRNGVNKKWLLGLLAAVPFIIVTLQHEFAPNQVQEAASPESVLSSPQSPQVVGPHAVIRPAENPVTGEGRTDEVPLQTSLASARPEPTPKKFYMSPQLYEVQQGDNLWNLAKQFYGDANLWPHIYRANLRTIKNPDLIYAGGQLVIPGLQQAPDNLSARDRELVAEGYFKVYQYYSNIDHPKALQFLNAANGFSFKWLQQQSDIPAQDWQSIK